jgi:hypothetical protein
LNAEHRRLLCTDDVISMGDNIKCVLKNFINSFKKFGPELNAERSKHMYKSRQIMLVKTAKKRNILVVYSLIT